MKLLRLWLLVMLAVLLPVRGALAATLLCAPAGMGSHASQGAMGTQAAHGHQAGAQAAAHGHADHDHGKTHHDPSAQDKCSVCSACCASPSLPSTPMGIDEPAALTSVSFPTFSAPTPTFESDGQERPPRTR